MQTQHDSNSAAAVLLLPPQVQMSSDTFLESNAEWLDFGALHGEAECPPEAIVNHKELGKGVRWALGIEAVAALSIYEIWHFFHLLF